MAVLSLGAVISCGERSGEGPQPQGLVHAGFFSGGGAGFELTLAAAMSQRPENRRRAVGILRAHWSDVRADVARLAGHDSVAKRMAGAYLMANLGSEEDLPALRKFLRDRSTAVLKQALPGVSRLEDRASIPLLREVASSAEYDVLLVVVGFLIEMDPAIGESECRSLAEDDDWARRRAAAQLAAALETQESAAIIASLLDDRVWQVQVDAAEAVGHRGLRSERDRLIELLEHHDWQVRAAAAAALPKVGRHDDVQIIDSVVFGDAEKKVRQAAAGSLAYFSEDQALDVIDRVLADPGQHPKVKRSALSALGQIDADEARARFKRALRSKDHSVSKQAEWVLQREKVNLLGR